MNADKHTDDKGWFDQEINCDVFQDKRLGKRLRILLEQLWNGIGQPITFACQDWAQTKAACRFLSSERVSEDDILNGHFQATRQRFKSASGQILILQDTTTFSFQRERPELIGYSGKITHGLQKTFVQCAIMMHSSPAVTADGLPLGLAAVKFWSRNKFKGCTALKRKINPTRVPIEEKESYRWLENLRQSTTLFGEPDRCVHIGDRESDIYELFCLADELKTHFLVRTCVNRLAVDGHHTTEQEKAAGLHHVRLRDQQGREVTACLEVKYRRITVLPPHW